MSKIKIFVKPATPGLVVRNPEAGFQPLPPHGAAVTKGAYWSNRLRDGSVVETTEQELIAGRTAARKSFTAPKPKSKSDK